jgi:hypothetical protein
MNKQEETTLMKLLMTAAMVTSLVALGCQKNNGSAPPTKPTVEQPKPQQEGPKPQQESLTQQPPQLTDKANIAAPANQEASVNKDAPGNIEASVSKYPRSNAESPEPKTLSKEISEAFRKSEKIVKEFEDRTEGYANGLIDSAGGLVGLMGADPQSHNRRDALDQSHDDEGHRERTLYTVKQAAEASAPIAADNIRSLLNSKDEATVLLTALVTEPDTENMTGTASQLVDELFNEPELARSKIMKLQIDLRRLADSNLYDDNAAARVAYVQALLDQRVKNDEAADFLRDNLVIAGSAVALGAISGFHGIERTRNIVGNWHPWARTRSAVSGAVNSSKDAIGSVGARIGAGVQKVINMRLLDPPNKVQRNLIALGLPEEQIISFKLTEVAHTDFPYQEFRPTNLPGFRYAVVNTFNDVDLGGDRRLIFTFDRFGREVFVSSRRVYASEADAVAEGLSLRSAEEGGPTFMSVMDTATGEVTATRLTAEEVQAAVEPVSTADVAKEPKAVRSRLSAAEARASGETPVPSPISGTGAASINGSKSVEGEKGFARRASEAIGAGAGKVKTVSRAAYDKTVQASKAIAQGAVNSTKAVAQFTVNTARGAVQGTANGVRTELRNFDLPWATAVTAGTAAPLYLFYNQGYGRGKRYGEGFETLYLESLIPREQLKQVTVDFNSPEK